MKENILYIKPEEEITSVVDKLIKIQAEEVFLVIPRNSAIAQSLVNLKLLKREADNLHKKITIVAQESALQRMAEKIGFSVTDSLSETETSLPEEPVLKNQISADEFEELLQKEKKPGPLRMVDIIQSSQPLAEKLISKKAKEEMPQPSDSELAREEGLKKETEPEIKIYRRPPDSPAASSPVAAYQYEGRLVSPKENLIPSFSIKIFGIFIVAAFIIAALVFYLVLPKAEITLAARTEKIVIELAVLADKSVSKIDAGAKKIPAQLVKLEERQSLEFPTTGERQLNEKAKGKITVFNAYSSSPQTLIETTRFLSQNGKIFRLIKTITIPGAKIEEGKIIPSSIEVDVEADQPGADYNIGPSDFTIPGFKGSPKYSGFYGQSTKTMSGGSTEKIKILTQEDFDKAKETLWQDLSQKIQEEIASQIPQNFKILEKGTQVQLEEIKSLPAVGEKGESFVLTIKGVAKALGFLEQDIFELLKKDLAEQLNDKKELINETAFSYKDVKADFDKGQMSFKVQGEQKIIWKIDEQDLKKIIAGKTEAQVREIFSQRPEIEKAQVMLWPFWIKKIPTQLNKIKISVDPVK